MKNKAILFFLLSFSTGAFAQDYKWQTKIDCTASDGFYKIQLPPAITSKLKSDFSDIRILDSAKHEVPYIAQSEQPTTNTVLFKDYKIVRLDVSKKHSTLVLQNPSKSKIDNVQLVIKNADADKQLRLSGSDNNKQWYVIKDNYSISDVYSHTETSVVKIFNFPLSDYEFLKIDISDSISPPLHILKAGYYDTHSENAKYVETPLPILTQKDSTETKTSYIKMSFSETQLIDKVAFEVNGPHYYMRDCELGVMEERQLKNNRMEKNFNALINFKISSNGDNTTYLNNYKSKELYLHILNNDNPPLKIKSAKCFQINHFLVAYLKSDESYSLVFGNEKVKMPNYDLVNFKDTTSSISNITLGKISLVDTWKKEMPSGSAFFTSNIFIWISLLAVLLILGFMSVRMIKETGKK
ncbi:MAG: hypothetical protein HY840_00700 [Bacteroidetes bacterium]|nr:hypothetical protein [Bacteroidota bacterium]